MKRFFSACMLVMMCIFAVPITANAIDYGVECSGDQAQSAFCNSKTDKDPLSGTDGNGLFINIVNIIAFVAGAAAIIVIVLSGIKYITSGGDAGKISSAKNTLVYAFIGLLVIAISNLLIRFVLSKL